MPGGTFSFAQIARDNADWRLHQLLSTNPGYDTALLSEEPQFREIQPTHISTIETVIAASIPVDQDPNAGGSFYPTFSDRVTLQILPPSVDGHFHVLTTLGWQISSRGTFPTDANYVWRNAPHPWVQQNWLYLMLGFDWNVSLALDGIQNRFTRVLTSDARRINVSTPRKIGETASYDDSSLGAKESIMVPRITPIGGGNSAAILSVSYNSTILNWSDIVEFNDVGIIGQWDWSTPYPYSNTYPAAGAVDLFHSITASFAYYPKYATRSGAYWSQVMDQYGVGNDST